MHVENYKVKLLQISIKCFSSRKSSMMLTSLHYIFKKFKYQRKLLHINNLHLLKSQEDMVPTR